MNSATMEYEQEIAALQADLGSVRSELDHWRSTAAKYEEEIGRLQEALAQQQQQHSSAAQLQGERPSCCRSCSTSTLMPQRLSFRGVCRLAAAVCVFAAGVRQPERGKNISGRETAAPGG